MLGAYLAAYSAVLSTVLGMLLLVATVDLAGGRWIQPWRPLAAACVSLMPVLAVLFLPVVIGSRYLYPWITPRDADASVRAIVAARHSYLNAPWAAARAAIYWAVWIGTAALARREWLRVGDGTSADAAPRQPSRALSAACVVLAGTTLPFAATDWMLSLEPGATSAAYGPYWYAGGSVAAISILAIATGTRSRGRAHVSCEALDAVRKLLLAYVLLWIYLAYVQYLVIWIADIPGEVGWVLARAGDTSPWRWVALVLVLGHFALPFLLLLGAVARRSAAMVRITGALLLAMHVVDAYWLVMPGLMK